MGDAVGAPLMRYSEMTRSERRTSCFAITAKDDEHCIQVGADRTHNIKDLASVSSCET